MMIHKDDVVLVKPSQPTPSETLSLSTIDNDPYIETLCKTIYVYKSSDDNDKNKDKDKDPSCLLREALSKALVYYYPLAGKLKRQRHNQRLVLRCKEGDGVPFVRATSSGKLCSLNYLDDVDDETARELLPVYEAAPESSVDDDDDDDSGYHPLAFQVTRFSCGGFTVGMALSHSVCDGFGAAQFFRAVAELAAGRSEPTVKPVWERERLVGKPDYSNPPKPLNSNLASVATSPYNPTKDMVREFINVTSDNINNLKAVISKELSSNRTDGNRIEDKLETFTTLEVLAAYVWRARFRALKLNPDGITLFGVAVGIRHVLHPRLPDGYYGNAFVKTKMAMTGKQLNECPLSHVAKLIRNLKKSALDADYISSELKVMEKTLNANVRFEGGQGAFMLLTDWRQLGLLEEVDFGWKESVNIIPLSPMDFPDICVFLPPSKVASEMRGGVRVLVTLPRAAMSDFKKAMDGLNKVGVEGDTCGGLKIWKEN